MHSLCSSNRGCAVGSTEEELRDTIKGGEGLEAGLFRYIPMVFGALGTVWILALMFLIVADVVGRNFLNMPITGVAEFAGRSVVAIVYLQLAWAVVSGRLTRAGFVLNLLAKRLPRVRCALEIFFLLVGATLFALLITASWGSFVDAWVSGQYFGVRGQFTMPTWPFRGLVVLGSALALLSFLALIPVNVRRLIEGRAEVV